MLDLRRDHPAHRKFRETIRRELFFIHATDIIEVERDQSTDPGRDELVGLLVDALALVPSAFPSA